MKDSLFNPLLGQQTLASDDLEATPPGARLAREAAAKANRPP